MWNQETDRMFLELRDDAVLIFGRTNLELLYMNPAAQKLFPDAGSASGFSDIFPQEAVTNLLNRACSNNQTPPLNLEEQPWFGGVAVIHAVTIEWESLPAVVITIDRRAYGPPPQALSLMKAVLHSAYFTSLRIDRHTLSASVISDKNVLMNTQAHFTSFLHYIEKYANAVIHPEDRDAFLHSFSAEHIRHFLDTDSAPACTVRRLSDEEYRWASYTLAAVSEDIVLLLGKDSNDMHLQAEELETVSQRNDYIVTSVSDIFRLMLHIDLVTGETMICSASPDLSAFFSLDAIYPYQAVYEKLLAMVHPEDREELQSVLSLNALCKPDEDRENRISFTYRRIDPDGDPNLTAKWTRSVLTFTAFDENQKPTEAVYAVQDIDVQKRQEIEAKRRQESLTAQFYTVIRNRYVWFVDNDYGTQISRCYRIANHTVMPPFDCPFGQFFEKLIMPNCHPEDYKRVAMALLPAAAEESYKRGKRQITIDYRHKAEDEWRFVRAEMYLDADAQGVLHTMIYVSDVDDEIKSQINITQSEHEQLILRRKIDRMIQASFLRIGEADLDTDTIVHYKPTDNDLVAVRETHVFSEYCTRFAEQNIYPEQRDVFRQMFSYDQILRAAREHKREIKHLFLVDPDGTQKYIWCKIAVRFFRNENGKSYVMTCIEDMNEEIQKRDANLHALYTAKEQLQENIREIDRRRILRAHVFMNLASSFQLALNGLYGRIDQMEHDLPEDERCHDEFSHIYQTFDQLSAMAETAKDMMLIENNQLPLLNQPTELLHLLRKIRQTSGKVIDEKHIRLITYLTHVTEETVLCDADRLQFLIDNLFINVIRSLPDHSTITLHLAQSPIPGQTKKAVYEFSLVTQGDSISQDIQSGILSPLPQNDPLRTAASGISLKPSDFEQHNLYFSKRLIALMDGTLDFVRLPDNATAVILRLPLAFVPKQIIFPLRYTFGRRALVLDSQQPAAIATMEMLRESGMQSDWQADYGNLKARLELAKMQAEPYDLVVLRQSDLNSLPAGYLDEILSFTEDRPVFIFSDAEPNTRITIEQYPTVRCLRSPVFRSVFAAALRKVFAQ